MITVNKESGEHDTNCRRNELIAIYSKVLLERLDANLNAHFEPEKDQNRHWSDSDLVAELFTRKS
ncbi:MAG: hypothetical protein KDC53_25310 [Saprospiraceae bacterium]|nr:hypothetical protein [Saprospiraceae bacterium]